MADSSIRTCETFDQNFPIHWCRGEPIKANNFLSPLRVDLGQYLIQLSDLLFQDLPLSVPQRALVIVPGVPLP